MCPYEKQKMKIIELAPAEKNELPVCRSLIELHWSGYLSARKAYNRYSKYLEHPELLRGDEVKRINLIVVSSLRVMKMRLKLMQFYLEKMLRMLKSVEDLKTSR